MRAPPTLATRRGFLATSAAAGAITLLTLQSDESIEIAPIPVPPVDDTDYKVVVPLQWQAEQGDDPRAGRVA
jgi:hypothetical protein